MTGPPDAGGIETTEDRWLGGRLLLAQPRRGYRVAVDAALLAAAVPLQPGERALELGTGVGAAALALACRVADAQVHGVELQPALAALARRNAAANGLAGRVHIRVADVLSLGPERYDEVFLNPPYLEPESSDPSADPVRRIATVEGPARLPDWLHAAARAARPGGGVTVIHRADRLDGLLAAAAAAGIGGLAVYPLWPQAGTPARRVILRGRTGRRGPLRLLPGLALHTPEGGFTAAAEAILTGAAVLEI